MNIAPFTVAVDTREQLPFSFQDIRIDRKKAFVLTQKRTLPTGDYSIVGYEDRICVERKSLEDLYQTLGNGRERFVRELERMQDMEFSAVVVEASLGQVKDPTKDDPLFHSLMNPDAVLGTIIAFAGQFHKTRWKFAGNRTHAEKITFKLLLQYYVTKDETEPLDTRQALGTPAKDSGSPESA
jgi:ERCC4-type nuclease